MQLDELEIISSIFCGPKELVIDDPGIIIDVENFIAGETDFLNGKLDYRILLKLSGFRDRLEVFVELPHYYPELEQPTVSISYPNINTGQHNMIKALIDESLTNLRQSEETFLFQFISWLQDDKTIRDVLENNLLETKAGSKPLKKVGDKLERLWIYSHHIKSKRKRSSITENARNLNLTGFSLPGKPGIICVEGYQRDTQEFWRLLKAMHWQKIQIRMEENENESIENDLNRFRKFNKFEEESSFTVAVVDCGAADDDNDNNEDDNSEVLRLNMSTFSTFLEQNNCANAMNALFGFKGK